MNIPSPSARLRPFRPVPFGRYTLLSPLAVGGMGEIFLARLEGAQGFEKLCVIKKILPAMANDPEFVDRFVNEAKILVKLSHGSIAQVLDVGLHEGHPYMALEYVDGKDLRKLAARARERDIPLPLTFILYVVGRVLDALAYAHRKRDDDDRELKLVHRDVSPQNILISYEGEVKVIDFGLAKSSLSSAKTNPSMILGKFMYMSPEQARHQPVDRRADLYAVGLCLYELVAGRNAFDDVPPHDVIAHVAQPSIRPIREIDPLCPPAVQEMIAHALEIDPARRFQTAEEFRARIQACLVEIDAGAGPESVSRYMRETFAAEYQQERKLLASLRTASRPHAGGPRQTERARNRETAVFEIKSVVPPTSPARPTQVGMPVFQEQDDTLTPVPLSFAPAHTPPLLPEPVTTMVDGHTVPVIVLDSDLEAMMGGSGRGAAAAVPWSDGAAGGVAPASGKEIFADPTSPALDDGSWSKAPVDLHIDLDGTNPALTAVDVATASRENTQPRVIVSELTASMEDVPTRESPRPPKEKVSPLALTLVDDLEITVRDNAASREEALEADRTADAYASRRYRDPSVVTTPAAPLVKRIAWVLLLTLIAAALVVAGAWLWTAFGKPRVTDAVTVDPTAAQTPAAALPVADVVPTPPPAEAAADAADESASQVPEALLEPLEVTTGPVELLAAAGSESVPDPVIAAAQVKEIRTEWAAAQKTFKLLRRRHGCGSRMLRAVCTRMSVLEPEMSELEQEPGRLGWLRDEVHTLREELRAVTRRGR